MVNRILEGGKLNYSSFAFRDYLDSEQNKCTERAFEGVTYHSLKEHSEEKEVMFWGVAHKAYTAIIEDSKESLDSKLQGLASLPAHVNRDDYLFDVQVLKMQLMALKVVFYLHAQFRGDRR